MKFFFAKIARSHRYQTRKSRTETRVSSFQPHENIQLASRMIERDIGRRAYTYDRCTPSRLLVPEKARKRDIARAKDNIFLFARIIVKFRRYSLFAPGNRSGPFGVFFCARLTKEEHRNSFYYTINDERGEKKKQYPAPGHDKRRANHITGILSAARSTLLFCFLFIEPFVLY